MSELFPNPERPFYLHGKEIDLRVLNSVQVMKIAKDKGYAWLLPLVREKESAEAVEVIGEAERILEKHNVNE